MKTTIITLTATVLFSVLTINSALAKGNNNTYKNVVMNEETRVQTTEISEGSNGVNLTPVQKYEVKFDTQNNPIEKIVYKWGGKQGWLATQKYSYEYNMDGKLSILSLAKWNNNKWEDTQFSVYNSEGNLLTTNYSE